MALIVIAGRASCPRYAQAEFIGGVLSNKLPHFKVRRMVIEENQWESWLWNLCKQNEWMHSKCPIVWRELAIPGGKGVLIGGVSEFLEFCHEYYGLTALLTPEEKKMLVEENLRIEMEKKKNKIDYKVRKVLITGAAPRILTMLVTELLNLKCLGTEHGTVVYLLDKSKKKHIVEHIQIDTNFMGTNAGVDASKIVHSLKEGLHDCDVLLIFNVFTRESDTNFDQIFHKNHSAMVKLAKKIDNNAPSHCRVVLAGPEDAPLCFNATVLLQSSNSLLPENVVVISSHIGAQAMPAITKITETKMSDFASPVVWGFIGLNQYIDFDNMIYKASYFVPNKRALKRIPNSTLPQGKLITELRKFNYLMETIYHIWSYIQQFKTYIKESSAELPELPRVKAIVTLLKLWYTQEYDREVLSLGIASDGSFGIPKGLVFSQPVYRNKDTWKPYTDYPLPDKSKCNMDDLINTAIYVLMENTRCAANQFRYVNREEREAEEKKKRELNYKYPEFPNPWKEIEESRTRNEVGVSRALMKIEQKWKHDEEKRFSPELIDALEGKGLYRGSIKTMRLSFHSIESLERRELEMKEEAVKDILEEIITKVENYDDEEEKKT